MRAFREFLDLPHWTEADLTEFIKAQFAESHTVEYKQGDWIFEDKDGRPVLRRRNDEMREYAAGISNVGGGLLFLGVPERTRGGPDTPDGVPRAVWGAKGPGHMLGNLLWDGIYPRLYPGPRIHDIPLASIPGRSVVIVEFPPPIHRYYRVLHRGGFVPVRFGDGLREAPPGLEAALAGERGAARPALEIRLPTEDELRRAPEEWFKSAFAASQKQILQYPVYVANHGLARAADLRVGVVTSYNECKQSVTSGMGTQWGERILKEMPRPLTPLFDVGRPLIRVLTPPQPLGPVDEAVLMVGVELDFGRLQRMAHVGIFAVAEGVSPVAVAYNIGGLAGGAWPSILNAAGAPQGPPFRWGYERPEF